MPIQERFQFKFLQEFVLDAPTTGLHVPPMVWAAEFQFSPDAVLAVLASHAYDPGDYIRDYEEWLRIAQR